jgi:hypothetical protein
MTIADLLLARAGDCCLVVTGSYHAAMFAPSQGVSVVALAGSPHYRLKFRGSAGQLLRHGDSDR